MKVDEFGFLSKKIILTIFEELSQISYGAALDKINESIKMIKNGELDIKMTFDSSMCVTMSHDEISVESNISLDEFNLLKKQVKTLNKIIDKLIED